MADRGPIIGVIRSYFNSQKQPIPQNFQNLSGLVDEDFLNKIAEFLVLLKNPEVLRVSAARADFFPRQVAKGQGAEAIKDRVNVLLETYHSQMAADACVSAAQCSPGDELDRHRDTITKYGDPEQKEYLGKLEQSLGLRFSSRS